LFLTCGLEGFILELSLDCFALGLVFGVEIGKLLACLFLGDIECFVCFVMEKGKVGLKAGLDDSFLLFMENCCLLLGIGKGIFLDVSVEVFHFVFDSLHYVGVCIKRRGVSVHNLGNDLVPRPSMIGINTPECFG
jgi:hypothetical protein